MTEDVVDVVELEIEKPLWRSIQARRYKIERREKKIEQLEQEIEDLYQEIANLRAQCSPGDIVCYKADPNKVKVVMDVEAIDYEDSLVYMVSMGPDGRPMNDMRQYPSDMMTNYEVVGHFPLDNPS